MINDERLLINDGVHTGNTEENGGPQADSFGERQLENEKCPRRTRRNTEGGPQADGGLGRIMITDSSDWTDVRRRTMWVNANYRELNVN